MLDIDDATDHQATASRERFLAPGLHMRISDLIDSLGGYSCAITEIDGRMLWIDLPIRRDGMLQLSPGQLVSVRFDRPGDAVYTFDSVVTDVRDDDLSPFALAMPVRINRRAHRSDARIALVLDAEYSDNGSAAKPGKVVDLSAGGLGLICSDEFHDAAELTIKCSVPGPDGDMEIERPCVVRTISMYGRTPAGTTLHQYGMEFLDDDEQLREQILTSVIWNLTQNPAAL